VAAAQPAARSAAAPGLPGMSDWTVPARYRGKRITTRVRYFPRKLLALTFDDGPDPVNTPQVLKILAQYHAHATFNVIGSVAVGHPELVRAEAKAGDCVGNHSWTHPYKMTAAQAVGELDRTAALIEKATGRPPTLYRAPGGFMFNPLADLALQRGYALIQWTVASADTTKIGPSVIAHNIIHTPSPGDIVLMHDSRGHQATVQALPQILRELTAAGWQFVTVPELLRAWDEWLAAPPPAAPAQPAVKGKAHG
jgi:peptidoglycan/xylan/chitin deacetylase (PgdA/CDA1 family)